jgi:hypothetical protein
VGTAALEGGLASEQSVPCTMSCIWEFLLRAPTGQAFANVQRSHLNWEWTEDDDHPKQGHHAAAGTTQPPLCTQELRAREATRRARLITALLCPMLKRLGTSLPLSSPDASRWPSV